MMWSSPRDHTHPMENQQIHSCLKQHTSSVCDAMTFQTQQLINPPFLQAFRRTSLPSAAIGCNSPLYAPAAGSSGWKSLALVVGRLSAENWHCAGRRWPWPPCTRLLCLHRPQAGWTCRCTGHAGSCASACCYNYCCYLRRYCCHLCCCSPSPSSAPLFHSSQSPGALPARASRGQSWTTASYQVAGEFYVLESVTAPLLLWLRVAFKAGSDNTGQMCSIHPNIGPPASQTSPNMDTFYFLQVCVSVRRTPHISNWVKAWCSFSYSHSDASSFRSVQ